MKIINPKFILTCNENFDILQNQSICFDEKILKIDSLQNLQKQYKNAKIINTPPNTILMPGLINPHTHLEFCSNQSILQYGKFLPWLKSVIQNKDKINSLSTDELMKNTLHAMLKSGTTSIGAISSMGKDLHALANSDLRVVIFNEILGTNSEALDILYNDFLNRYYASCEFENKRFVSGVSIHAPYSTHKILAKKTIEFAKQNDLLISTHFLESIDERQWLEYQSGEFKDFFAPFDKNAKPFYSINEFIKLFENTKTLFTHCAYVDDEQLQILSSQNATITHCIRSNKLLGSQLLNIKKVLKNNINFTIATDGLSSNLNLNLWDELRANLFAHQIPLKILSKILLHAVTKNAAVALGLKTGMIKKDYHCDFLLLNLQQMPSIEDLALHVILHTTNPSSVFVQGKCVS